MTRPDWFDLAECRGMDPALFHPDRGGTVDSSAIIACARCTVRQDCLNYAVDTNQTGYWGGKSERQRKVLRSASVDVTEGHATALILAYLHSRPGEEVLVSQLARHIKRSESSTRQACLTLNKKGLIRSVKRRGYGGGAGLAWYVPADVEVT